ncbi:VCBS repeat-containing protein [Candidatus Kaiserbacteria bacterium]|nr:VCBS repeat-containing protein [Candidatus Kaiserbacteria bacterium]
MKSRNLVGAELRRITRVLAVFVVSLFSISPAGLAFAAFGDGSPTVPNASVFSAVTEDPKIDGSTGAFTQRVPLDILPGRNGLQPDIALDYNSQRTRDGIVGYGWELSIPYIERLNKIGSQELYGTIPYFTSSIDGELVASSTSSGATTTATISIETNSNGPTKVMRCTPSSDPFSLSKSVSSTSTLLIAHIDTPFISSVTYAGVNTTRATSTGGVETWYLANPTSGTNDLVVNLSQSSGGYVSAVSYTGTDTSDPIGAMAYNTGSTGNTSVLITTESNYSAVDDQVFYDGTQTLTANSPQIQQLTDSCSGNFSHGASVLKTTSSGLQSLGWTHSAGDGAWIEIAVEVKAPSASSGSAGTYLAKVDDGSFNVYTFATTSWTMYDKRGTRYTFGSDDSGRMYDTGTGTSTNTYRWMLQEIRDTNDNYIEYTYLRDNNTLYPDTITYTGKGSTDGPFTITFATTTRPDARISYASGFSATTTKRIYEIDASVNGSTVRKYLLGYGTGNNSLRSLLTSIVQQGYDDNNTLVTLPAMTFSYASSSTQYFGPAIQNVDGADYAVADTDGNGINDVNLFMPGTGNGFMWHDNEASAIAVPDASHAPPEYWASTGYPNQVPLERGVRYLDINGDGKADAVRGWIDDSAGTSDYAIYNNQYSTTTDTYGWSATSTSYTGNIPTFAKKTSGGLYLTGGLFGDVNGDGLPDYLTALTNELATSTYLGNGSAWDRTVTVFPAAKSFPSTAPTETASQLVDINGDNLDDWVYSAASSTYVLLNNGSGWNSVPDSHWTFATSTTYLSNGNYYDRGIRFMDMNGDGLTDLVRSYLGASGGGCVGTEVADVKAVYLNTGSGWATSTRYTLPAYIATCNAGTSTIAYNEFVNFYGNGQMQQDVITNVTNPKGGGIAIAYKMAGNPGSAIRVLAASTTVTHDGLGNYATTTYSYSNGHWYNTTVRDRRFAGFSPVTVTNPDSIVTTHYGQNSLARIGRPTRKDVSDTSNNLKQRALYRWDTVEHGDSTFIGLGRQVTLDYASDGTHRDKAIDYHYSSTTNDLIQTIEYGEVSGNTDSAEFTDSGTDKRTTNISYAASSTVNMSVPTQKTLLDYNGATSTDQKFYYDSLAFGSVNVGNNTKQEDWISGTMYASSTKTHNSYGLVATSTDRNGNATSYVYDANNLYVATSTNALLQKTQLLYNYANGKVRWKNDPNESLMKNVFDGVGRLKEVDVSSTSTPSTYATTTVYTYIDSTTTPSSIQRSDWLFPGNTVDTYQYFDGFNRLFQERKESPDSNIFLVTDRKYSQVGLLASSTLPYSSSSTAYTTPTATTALYTNYLYDPLKRLTSEANAVGTKTNSYAKWTTTATDPNGNTKVYWYDAFGNLATVVERGLYAATTTAVGTSISIETGTNGPANTVMCSSVASVELSKTVSATSTLLLVQIDSPFVSTVKYAGVDMTFATSTGGVGTWYLTNPTSGSNNVVVTFSPNSGGYVSAVSYTGTDTVNPIGAMKFNTGTTGDPSISITTQSDNSIVDDNLWYNLSQTLTANSPQIQQLTNQCSNNFSHGASVLKTSTSSAQSLGWTHTTNSDWIEVAVEARVGNQVRTVPVFATTTHSYDVQNNLATTTDSRSNVRGFTYDGLGRRLSAQDLHNATDTTFGIWSYTYDHQGNLTSQTDPKAQTVNRTYDALNRMLTENYTGASGTEVTLVYDSCTNGIGYLCSASSTSATSTNSYDILGRILSATTTILNNAYNMQYSYDRQGNVTSWTYPNSTAVTVGYNNAGLPSRIQRKPSGGSFSDIVSSLTYAPTSQSITTVFGSGASTTRTYNADALYRLTNLKTLANSSNVQDFSYTYDPAGNITQLANPAAASSSATTVFSYDALNRLLQASTTAADSLPYKQQYEYDTLGSMLALWNGTASSTYAYSGTSYANPHAVTEISNGVSTTTYSYDNNGNLSQKTTDNVTTTYLWDYANRLTALGVNNSTTTYGYDAFGARVYQIASTTATTTYASKWYSVASSTRSGTNYATTTEYIFSSDTLLSTIDQAFTNGSATGTAEVRYIHPDHLGSTNIVSNANNTAVMQTLDYYPYGSTRIDSGTDISNREFIGQFFDEGSGLSYLNARYYDGERGQFLSQDPLHLAIGTPNIERLMGKPARTLLANPQLLNSYSYAGDNPISNSDPSGLLTITRAGIETYFYPILEGVSGVQTARSVDDAWVVSSYESTAEIQADKAQRNVDLSLFAVGSAASYLYGWTGYGALINVAGITLAGIDVYCAKHECRNLDSGNLTPQQIAQAVISGTPLSSPPPSSSGGGSGNNRPAQQQSTRPSESQQSAQGGSSSGGSVSSNSFAAQIAAIQARINVIRAQLNALIQRAAGKSKSGP